MAVRRAADDAVMKEEGRHVPEEGRSLRDLQRELESLKSSLSVYLGSGLA